MKNIVYQAKINDLQHLKARIRDAVATVNTRHGSSNVERGRMSSGLFAVPPRGPTLNFTQKDIYSKTTSIVSLCNGVTHDGHSNRAV
jgi:hypothetical protein